MLTGKTEASIRVRLHRARGRMRKALCGCESNSRQEAMVKPALAKERVCVAAKPEGD
jgi:hypothetical protein